jgi:hypothetical protein
MKSTILHWLESLGKRPADRRRRSQHTTRRAGFERLESRVALSSLPAVSFASTVPLAVSQATQTLVASNVRYTTPANTPLVVSAPGLLAYVSPRVSGLSANFGGTGPSHGALSLNPNGSFTYTPSVNYSGADQFTYYATAGTLTSNVATVFITVKSRGATQVPGTPFYNALHRRWSIDPARFDYYHPRIGAIFGLESTGIPGTPTSIVPVNKDFNVTLAHRLYDSNPQKFDQKAPIIGALFQLENPTSGPPSLLPATAFMRNQQALYNADPAGYQVKHFYLGAIFAIERLE